jgi:hypothetical protein
MRYFLYAMVLLMGVKTHAQPQTVTASIESLSWMAGSWMGLLGEQTVEETWSSPKMGSMDTMIKLSSPKGVQMIELIVIREVRVSPGENTLSLHLRQFSPDLEARAKQDMELQDISTQSVSFVAGANSGIKQLSYALLAQDQLKVKVTVETGDVFSVNLRPK